MNTAWRERFVFIFHLDLSTLRLCVLTSFLFHPSITHQSLFETIVSYRQSTQQTLKTTEQRHWDALKTCQGENYPIFEF